MATIFAQPYFRGTPLGALTFYASGTLNLATIYSDTIGTTQDNPARADSAGRYPAIYLDDDAGLRMVETDLAGIVKRDIDPVNGGGELAGAISFTQALTTTYPSGSIGAKLRGEVSVKDAPFNAVGDGVADDTAAIQAAIDYVRAGLKSLFVPAGNYNVTGLTIPMNGGPSASFWMHGDGVEATRIVKIGASVAPLIDVVASPQPSTVNFQISDLSITGNAKNCDGIRMTAIGSANLSRLFVRAFDNGISWVGAIGTQLEYTYIAGCNIAVKARANVSLSSYNNANSISHCRMSSNIVAIDYGQGDNLRVRDNVLEINGTPGDLTTGAIIIRSTVDDEVGYCVITLDGNWIEQNSGWSIQVEAIGADRLYMNISNSNILSSEGGRVFYSAGGGQFAFHNVMAPSAGDTITANCYRLMLSNVVCSAIAGTQTYQPLIENTNIGSAPVEGTHQRSIQIGGGNGLRLSAANGGTEYKLAANAGTGNLDLTVPVGGTSLLQSMLSINLQGRVLQVSGTTVVGPQGASVANATNATDVITQLNALLARVRAHGLIAP